MKAKNIFISLVAALCLVSCEDYLTAPEPGVTKAVDYYSSGQACIYNVNACYAPLCWEYSSTYSSEWFIGDIVSDDALKGGQNTNDMAAAYDMENWKTISNNDLLNDVYRSNYLGIGRCNLALKNIPGIAVDDVMTAKIKARILAEAHFLRAYYYFRLLRIFGGVPLTLDVIETADKWTMPRASVSDVFDAIIADLLEAEKDLWLKSEYADEDLGRVTKGAAQAMLMKVYLYMAGDFWQKQGVSLSAQECYKQAKYWGDLVIASGQYQLNPDYIANFTLEGENGMESVFEIQYVEDPNSDYGADAGGFGMTRGTFSVILTRSRSSKLGGGWGFNKPTTNLYNEFETGDKRRDATILDPMGYMENNNEETYLGDRYLNRKYALYDVIGKNDPAAHGEHAGKDTVAYYKLAHATRGPINNKQIRYADVLLMHAEACIGAGDEGTAVSNLNEVRSMRNMPTYPGYKFKVNGTEISSPTLLQAVRHERRVELAMEGHRWFDIVRWNGAEGNGVKAHMEAYQATETDEAKSHMAAFQEGKHELMPIPAKQRELNGALTQNQGY